MTCDVLPELIVVNSQEQSLALAPVGTLVPTLNPSHKNAVDVMRFLKVGRSVTDGGNPDGVWGRVARVVGGTVATRSHPL